MTRRRSESVPITLTLTSPDGKHVDFYTTSVFAYAGKESTEDLVTTPAQWFGSTGRYTITAASTSVPATAELAFDVVDPAVATPLFADVSEAGRRSDVDTGSTLRSVRQRRGVGRRRRRRRPRPPRHQTG